LTNICLDSLKGRQQKLETCLPLNSGAKYLAKFENPGFFDFADNTSKSTKIEHSVIWRLRSNHVCFREMPSCWLQGRTHRL